MRPKERQLQIIDIIRLQGRVSVDDLVTEFASSPETIRRDLSQLARKGKILKVHGGAMLPGSYEEGAFQVRMSENTAAKRLIAKKASQLISPGDTIAIDTGSTTVIFAEEICRIKDLTVITNSTEIAKIIGESENDSNVFLLGGEYNPENKETVGSMVMSQLTNFHVKHAVVTVAGLDPAAGVMDFDADEVAVAATMLGRANNVIVLADSSKFNIVAPFVVASFDKIDQLVCDVEPDEALKAALKEGDVEIHCEN